MRPWRQHWNHQLYKALEHQYQMGLEALNKNLPEIHIDLTFKSVDQLFNFTQFYFCCTEAHCCHTTTNKQGLISRLNIKIVP